MKDQKIPPVVVVKWFVLVLVACSSSPAPTKAPSPPPPVDAAIDAPSVDAAPVIDPALTAAPASVFRFHASVIPPMPGVSRLETWTLRTAEGQGMVVVERMIADGAGWKPASTSQYLGTATDDGKTLVLALAAGTDQLALTCTRDKLAAATATAVLKPHPKGKYKPCGDPGRFVPAKTTSLAVLRCMHPDFDSPMLFAPAAGVEYLQVIDDCQNYGGYRVIAADGSIAPSP